MESKKVLKKCPMLNGDWIVRLARTRSIRCYECGEERRGEGCLVIYDFVASFKAKKRKVCVGDAWFQVSPTSLPLSELEF